MLHCDTQVWSYYCTLASVRLWKFKDGGSLKAIFLQCGDQVSRISFDFLKWRSMGPQKLATIIGHKYSILNLQKKIKVFLNQFIRLKKNFKIFNFLGVMNLKNCVYISCKIQVLTILRHKITQFFSNY